MVKRRRKLTLVHWDGQVLLLLVFLLLFLVLLALLLPLLALWAPGANPGVLGRGL